MLLAVLGGILLLILILLFLPTEIGLDYLMEHKEQVFRIRVRVLGIPFSFKIPTKKDKSKLKEGKDEKEGKSLTPKKFISFSKSLYHGYLEIEDECKALIREIKKRFACQEVFFVIRYGTTNPARTGILNGAIWTAGTLILKVLDSVLGVKKKTMEVYPDFNRAFMCIHIKGSFRFNFFDAARTVLKIIKLVNLIKNKMNSQETNDRI